jgi:hypothetical protein
VALVDTETGAVTLALKWTGAVLDSATCLALAWAGWRLLGPRAGAVAALLYAVSSAPFPLFSAGNYTNIFSQAMLNVTLLGGLIFLGKRTSASGPWGPALLTLGFALTVLGHYGMMLAALAIGAGFALWVAWRTVRGANLHRSLLLLTSWTAALLGATALYYRHFFGVMGDQWGAVLGRLLGDGNDDHSIPESGSRFFLGEIARRALDWIGALPLVGAALGLFSVGRLGSESRALLTAWLLASAGFAVLEQIVGDTVRWYYLAAPALALLTGRYLALLLLRGKYANLLVGLSVATILFHMLALWVGELIFTRYH